ncbi:MAG: ABC transporter permease [Treponema sp.]|nr:ABC transporter permease [Treponema sp.]
MISDTTNQIYETAVVEKVPSTLQTIWKEIWQSKPSFIALVLFFVIILGAFIISAQIDMETVSRVNLRTLNLAPQGFGGQFILGTDHGGRDMLQMLFLGARTSFIVALWVTFITVVFGVLYGLIAGFFGGWVEMIMMRIAEFFIMLPTMMIIIIVVTTIPNYTTWHFIIVLSAFAWMGRARLIRSKVLQQAKLDYVSASKTLGSRNIVIIFREVLPNVTSLIVTNSILALAGNMGLETGLTILGYGLPHGTPNLGRYISLATDTIVLQQRAWQWLPASILIFIMILCIYLVGSAVSRAVDPKQQQQR